MLSPIVVFTFNRCNHTRQTIESLAANELAAESDLFIYSDGPRGDGDKKSVAAVREYIATIEGFRSITIKERHCNYGLADSIVDGVTEVVNKHGKIIVLEDDMVLSPYFLQYMNAALEFYKSEERVMHIAGYMLPIDITGLPEAFFMRQSSCWGWATWDRAWQYFFRGDDSFDGFSDEEIHRFNLDGYNDYWVQAVANREGRLKTWAVYWYASVFKRKGLCLHPRTSLVDNIGHDGSGANCGWGNIYGTSLLKERISEFPTDFSENALAMQRFQLALHCGEPGDSQKPLLNRTLRFFKNIARKAKNAKSH